MLLRSKVLVSNHDVCLCVRVRESESVSEFFSVLSLIVSYSVLSLIGLLSKVRKLQSFEECLLNHDRGIIPT